MAVEVGDNNSCNNEGNCNVNGSASSIGNGNGNSTGTEYFR